MEQYSKLGNDLSPMDAVLSAIQQRDRDSLNKLVNIIPNYMRRYLVIGTAYDALIENNDLSSINWLLENYAGVYIEHVMQQIVDKGKIELLRQLFITHRLRLQQLLDLSYFILNSKNTFGIEIFRVVGEQLKSVEDDPSFRNYIEPLISYPINQKIYPVAEYLLENFNIDSDMAYRFVISLLVSYATGEELNFAILLISKITGSGRLDNILRYLPAIYQDYSEDILIKLYNALLSSPFYGNQNVINEYLLLDLIKLGKIKVVEFLLPYLDNNGKIFLLEELLNQYITRKDLGSLIVKLLLSSNISIEFKKTAITASNLTSKYASPNVFKELIIRIYLTAPSALRQELMEFEEVQTFDIDSLLASASKRQLRNPDVAMEYIIRLINQEYAPEGEEGRKVISGYVNPQCLNRNIEDVRTDARSKVPILEKKILCHIIDTFKGSFKFEGMNLPCDRYSDEELKEVVLTLVEALNVSELCWILGLSM
jgi:hypothetical protein